MPEGHEMRVVDTNVVSFAFRRDPLLAFYLRHFQGHDLAISFMTIAEQYAGALCADWGPKRRLQLDRHLQNFFVIDSDEDICHWYAYVLYQRWSRPLSVSDAWIAATALSLKLELITHNPADFRGITGLKIITEAP